MATKLLCPQCRIELPTTFSRGKAGACPRCRTSFSAPRERKRGKSAVVLQSRPHLTTFDEAPTRNFKTPLLIGFLAASFLLAVVAWRNWPTGSSIAPMATPMPTTAAKPIPIAAPSIEAQVPDDVLVPVRPTAPKVRPIRPIESTAPNELAVVRPSRPIPSSVDQDRVGRAVQKGIDYLKANTHRWIDVGSHPVGCASLPGLALLEVGVPATDPAIVKAANLVRARSPQLRETYDISLAVLFLDRLGDPTDEPLIRSLALRLVAGQTSLWGWNYHCKILPAELETPLQTALERLGPQTRWQTPLAREPGKGLIDLKVPMREGAPILEKPISGAAAKSPTPSSNLVMPLILGDPDKSRDLVKELPLPLQSLPGLQPPLDYVPAKGRPGSRDDNSNTQFALLALWAARRHGVPVDRALLLADRRFAQSQGSDGAWGYHVWDRNGRPSMTCVGLLGLALGHGTMLPAQLDAKTAPAGDPAIQRGLEALSRRIGDFPRTREDDYDDVDLYFLWSLERVAMMYQLPTIGGKDWYGWGATFLLKSQRPDGSWPADGHSGSSPPIATAFALLFLNRSNLVPDLTERLHLHMAISDRP